MFMNLPAIASCCNVVVNNTQSYNLKSEMNCEVCQFAPEGVCLKEPKPVVNKDGRCPFFIKRRMK